ncbi:MAG TPA: hypothetical protein VF520_02220 [Thermoleophilaceae bacterium]|jgi:hypothetical protein
MASDGLPATQVNTPEGVSAPGGSVRYVSMAAGRGTVLGRIDRSDGEVELSRFLARSWGIPGVAVDGSASGLSGDGRTLVLMRVDNPDPRRRTTMAIVDPATLRIADTVTLRGQFGFDAISPDGRSLYLVQYRSPRDPKDYAVRAYDARRDRLLPAEIVDPRKPDEKMQGTPITRTGRPDGRWAYTLYDGSEHPFVHALDTAAGKAYCIDLDWLSGRPDLYDLRLSLGGPAARTLTVSKSAKPVALVDTRTLRASVPKPADGASADRHSPDGRSWPLLGIAAAALLASVAAAAGVRRRRPPAHGAA